MTERVNHNLKTPEEAAKLWCPFVRQMRSNTEGKGPAVNRNDVGYSLSGHTCIGPKCMMWHRPLESYREEGYCGLVKSPWG